jgi:hypothetical protein
MDWEVICQKLLSTASKLFANILKNKLNKYAAVILDDSQNAFRKGRGCIDPVFTLKQLIEKLKEYNQPLYLVFIDYEKDYDNVNSVISSQVLFHDGTLLHSQFNTQLLITVHNSSRIRTHV